jgi:hypothetical protein
LDDVRTSPWTTTFEADEGKADSVLVIPGYKIRPMTELGTAGSSSPYTLHSFPVVYRESCMQLPMPTARIRCWADLVVYVADQAEVRRSPYCRSRGCHRHDSCTGIGYQSSNMAFNIYETGLAEIHRTVCTYKKNEYHVVMTRSSAGQMSHYVARTTSISPNKSGSRSLPLASISARFIAATSALQIWLRSRVATRYRTNLAFGNIRRCHAGPRQRRLSAEG